jgi:hypothetical protein
MPNETIAGAAERDSVSGARGAARVACEDADEGEGKGEVETAL